MTITDVAGLEALPEDAVILDALGYVFHSWGTEGWKCAGNDDYDVACITLPAVVLSASSPRTVTHIEERFSDAVNERVSRAQQAIVLEFEGEGSTWVSNNSGDYLASIAAEAIRGMLARPACLIVTPEQVEAGARAIWESGAPPDDHEPWRVASDDDRADFRRDLIAALAAMGIKVMR